MVLNEKNKEITERKPLSFLGGLKKMVLKVVPERSLIYKTMHLKAVELDSNRRNARKTKLAFDVSVVDSCNLNCVGCAAFSPLCKYVFMDINSFEKDIKRISELSGGEIEYLRLSGGEVLQHPQLIDFLTVVRKYLTKGEIAIITNGVLLDKQDEFFWQSCKRNDIKIYITPYPIKLKFERIMEIAKKYQVALEWFSAGDKISFTKLPLNINGNGNAVKNFKRCTNSNTCVVLRDGKMYACGRPLVVRYFNDYFGQDFKVSEKDCIDIYNVESIDEILDFVCKPIPFCRYCDIDNMKFGIKWGISKKEIGEWV
jgi:hypothetical protein